jgi:hypothetical protein
MWKFYLFIISFCFQLYEAGRSGVPKQISDQNIADGGYRISNTGDASVPVHLELSTKQNKGGDAPILG